jgi:hypothetical protein
MAKELARLIGEPFWYIGRAADLAWLGFGTIRRRGHDRRLLARYALHLNCPWRIRRGLDVIVGSGDVYREVAGSQVGKRWRWDVGPNLFDERVEMRLKQSQQPIAHVRRVVLDRLGGLRISMTKRLMLEVFPADTDDSEYREWWRFFQPGSKRGHLVWSRRAQAKGFGKAPSRRTKG